MFGLGRDY